MSIKFKVKNLVTVPLLKVPDDNTPVYVCITSAIFTAKDTNGKTAATNEDGSPKTKQQPPRLAHVVNLETGEVQQIIVGAVLESELKDAYSDDSYVGKSFEIKKAKPTGSKRYAMYQIAEIEVEEGDEQQKEAPAKSGKKAA
jgi:hypothetical protein